MSRPERDIDALRALVAPGIGDVADLVADARSEAEARVRGMLVEAFTGAILERVRSELDARSASPASAADAVSPASAPAEAPTAQPAAAAPPASADEPLGWYVYCVVGSDHPCPPGDLAGLGPAQPVTTVAVGDVAAVVSRVPLAQFGEEALRERLSDMAWLEATARAHEHVLEQVARAGTPIPMRLCTIYESRSGLEDMLGREAAALREALSHLRGRTEWGVKVFACAPAAEGPGAARTQATEPSGTAYMRGRLTARRRDDERERELSEACAQIETALASASDASVTSPPQRPEVSGRDEPMILNGSYLVFEDEDEEFHAAVARLQAEYGPLGLDLVQTGPWPPYNFVPGAIGAAW